MSDKGQEWSFSASRSEKVQAVVFFLTAAFLSSRFIEWQGSAIGEERWFGASGLALLLVFSLFAIGSGLRLLRGKRMVRKEGEQLFFLDPAAGFGRGRWRKVDQVSDDQIQFHLHSGASALSFWKKEVPHRLAAYLEVSVERSVKGLPT